MSQTMPPDREVGGGPGGPVDDRRDQPLQGESTFGDSSGQLFSIYSKAAEDEDNKMVDRWQKDADGILIFTGLFSAAVAALLAVTVQDLRPNSQDISAFYLGNIFQVLADPNATRSSIPSPVAKPPSFSPSRYAVWVNSFWFLSLVMSLSCALWATSLQQWARRYLRRAQPSRCSPEKRARMRAFFSEGVDKMHIPWAVEGLPTLLHLSLFLFFCGLAIFLFDVNREVFSFVIWWIGLFSLVYGMITLLPLVRQDSPYNSPLSTPAWFLYATMTYVTVQFLGYTIIFFSRSCSCFCFCSDRIFRFTNWMLTRIGESGKYYRRRMLRSVEKAAEETVSERLSKIDVRILDWTITTLGDDDSLKNFFEAVPGFFNSKLVNHHEGDFPEELLKKYSDRLDGFLSRTWTSNLVNNSEKLRRLGIAVNAMSLISHSSISFIVRKTLLEHWDEMPQTVEVGQALARLCTSKNQYVVQHTQFAAARILGSVWKRDDNWVMLASQAFGLLERDLWDNIAVGDDSVLLVILIHITRRSLRSDYSNWVVLEALSKLDIRNTHPRLQHDFCTLWNEIVLEARKQRPFTTPVTILKRIRLLYIALHQGTDAAPTAFSSSTHSYSDILYESSSYPLCNLASHRPYSAPHISFPVPHFFPLSPIDGRNTTSRQAEQVNTLTEPPSSSNPTTTSEIGETSQGPYTTPLTNLAFSSRYPTDYSQTGGAAATTQTIASIAMLSHPQEGNEQQDVVASCADPVIGQILSIASTPTPILGQVPTFTPPVLDTLESCDSGAASASNSESLLAATPVVVGFSNPVSPPSYVLSSPNADFIALLSSTTSPYPTGNAKLPRLHARGLANSGNMCFANAVLHILVRSPPFCNLFKQLGSLKGQRGGGIPETDGGMIPLVDATTRFIGEFLVKEKESPPIQLMPRQVAGEMPRADEEKKKHNALDPFDPTYMYDVMKEKRQLNDFLVSKKQDAEGFFRLYLDALDQEFLSAVPRAEVKDRRVSQSGQAEVGNRGSMAESIESPLTRIFSGRSCSTVRAPNQPDIVTIEDWRSLQLDIQDDSVRTVQDALARISHPQPVHNPSGNEACRQMLIEVLPPVLVVHLKRSLDGAAVTGVVKIGKPVQFTPDLEIPPDIMAPIAQKSTGAQPGSYTLYGVLYHYGVPESGGRYTVDVLHPNGNGGDGEGWLHIDDEAVSSVQHEDVFGGHDSGKADDRCPYLLFYRRTASTGTL